MTHTLNLQAAAMRARAAEHCSQVSADCKKYNLPQAAGMVASVGREILAMPIEASHADLLAAAGELDEVRALVSAAALISVMNDNYAPFGGEIYQDLIDRAWPALRDALAPFARKAGV